MDANTSVKDPPKQVCEMPIHQMESWPLHSRLIWNLFNG